MIGVAGLLLVTAWYLAVDDTRLYSHGVEARGGSFMGGRYSNMSRRRVGRPFLALLATAVALLVLPAVAAAGTVVSLTFDDSLTSQGQVRPLLSARQMHATFYVNSARIDEA